MIGPILDAAEKLNTWLKQHLGRPYNMLLGIGLIIEIVARIRDFRELPDAEYGLVRTVMTLLLYTALFINQLTELRERTRHRHEKKGSPE